MVQLLKLRYLQLKRDLGYWVFILAAAVFFITEALAEFSDLYAMILTVIILLFLYSYHINRKDINFIQKYLESPKKNLFINYNLLLLPVSLAMLTARSIPPAITLHAGATLTLYTRIKPGDPRLYFIGKYIPAAQFEWIAGLRKNLVSIIPLLLVAIFLSPVKFFGVVALFLLNSIFLGFYSTFEPFVMLNPEGLNSTGFLKRKVLYSVKAYLIINIPLLLINSVFQPDIAWFNICFILGFLLLLSFTIYTKYENYRPNDEIRFHVDSLIIFAATIIPFLLPIAYFINGSHKKRAFKNLSNYLDDHS